MRSTLRTKRPPEDTSSTFHQADTLAPGRRRTRPLGTVQQHAAIGALALRPDGRYLQINGDVEQELNGSRVEKALRSSRSRPDGGGFHGHSAPRASEPYEAPAPQAPRPPVIVSIKRRRVPVMQNN